jgi:hypothetical protein
MLMEFLKRLSSIEYDKILSKGTNILQGETILKEVEFGQICENYADRSPHRERDSSSLTLQLCWCWRNN